MVVRSFPHQTNMGNWEFKRILTDVRRLCGHWSGVPIAVCDQSKVRVSAPISPPPCKKEKEEGEVFVFTCNTSFYVKGYWKYNRKLNHNEPFVSSNCGMWWREAKDWLQRRKTKGCVSCTLYIQKILCIRKLQNDNNVFYTSKACYSRVCFKLAS